MNPWSDDPAAVRPMLATLADVPLESSGFAYEPKYDGIRALASVSSTGARLWSRLGNEKTSQFPEVAESLHKAAAVFGRPVLVDGEIVALDRDGEPIGFQNLQGRIHLKSQPSRGHADTAGSPVAFIVFDILRDGDEDVRALPLRDRRHRLERLFSRVKDSRLRISEQVVGSGGALHDRATRHAWEGLIAKRLDSPYRSARRSPDWCKIKLVKHQTCVVGGWTAPRGSRPFLGALLLGLYDDEGRLQYVGHTGAGFSDAELGRVWKKLQTVKTKASPFATVPRTNEQPHWARPVLVAEVKFTEWTADRKLRHPTYLGLRDDVKPESVRMEPQPGKPATRSGRTRSARAAPGSGGSRAATARAAERAQPARPLSKKAVDALLAQVDAVEARGGDGVLELPGGDRLEISHLTKPYWPAPRGARGGAITKADLFRHYLRVAPYILPVLADRPLVMKRYPNGVTAKPFYQHRAPDRLPPGVRVAAVATDVEERVHIVGGGLKTLLYTAQLASISQDPWFSRVGSEDVADHVAIDLDPPDGLPFTRVLDVARWVRDELAALKAPAFPKTSGSGGLHVYVPMPPGTPYGAGLLFCQIVATIVATRHPEIATVERALAARGRRIYVDYLQNAQGKTLASAYSPRANDFAGVSTPLTWAEVDEGVAPQDFTLRTFPARLESVGDLWAGLRKSKGADLGAIAAALGGARPKAGARRQKVTRASPTT